MCRDVNECDSTRNGGCVENSLCINTLGSFLCGECNEGFIGNQSVGCRPHPGTCPDGTICDGNAECFTRRGFARYQCRVRKCAFRGGANFFQHKFLFSAKLAGLETEGYAAPIVIWIAGLT